MISIGYMTSRRNPRLHWVLDGLARQHKGRAFELIVVDFYAEEPGRKTEIAQGRELDFLHVPPKPTAWQGKYRQTTRNYFDPANARNTVACLAKGHHLAFIDDLSVLGPLWFDQIFHSAHDRYIMCGAYKKVKDLVVVDGELVSYTPFPSGVDSRWNMGSDGGIVPCQGGQMFGCSFAIPIDFYLDVGGQDEIHSGCGGEDFGFGLSLQKAGHKLWYNRNALSYEDEDAHYIDEPMIRLDKRMGDTYSSNVLLDKLLSWGEPKIFGNDFDIKHIRRLVQAGKEFPHPKPGKLHWPDNQPLSEM